MWLNITNEWNLTKYLSDRINCTSFTLWSNGVPYNKFNDDRAWRHKISWRSTTAPSRNNLLNCSMPLSWCKLTHTDTQIQGNWWGNENLFAPKMYNVLVLSKTCPNLCRVRASVYVSIFQTSFTGMWIFFEEICSSRKQLNPIKAPCGQTYLPAIAVQGVGSNRILVTVPVPEQFSKAWSTNVATHFRLRQTGG